MSATSTPSLNVLAKVAVMDIQPGEAFSQEAYYSRDPVRRYKRHTGQVQRGWEDKKDYKSRKISKVKPI